MKDTFIAHTIPQDLPPAQSCKLMIRQMQSIQSISSKVFERVQAAVDTQHEHLKDLEEQLQKVEANVACLRSQNQKALNATAPVQYPLANAGNQYFLFDEAHGDPGLGTTEQLEASERIQIQRDDKAKELYAFFKQALLQQRDPAQALDMRQRVDYVTNLFAFGVQNLTSRLQEASAAGDLLAPSSSSQRQIGTENVHLAVQSLTTTLDRPLLSAEPSREDVTERSSPLQSMSRTSSAVSMSHQEASGLVQQESSKAPSASSEHSHTPGD